LEEKKIKKNILDSINIYRDKLNLQINTLIYSYALENGFDYVYSPAGSGTFMYADSNLNITNDVIYYLNSR
jgi:Skp family chaperone for outer membrane proteins